MSTALPDVLARLERLTAICDTHLLEQALLDAAMGMIDVASVALYRLGDTQAIVRVISCNRAAPTSEPSFEEFPDEGEIAPAVRVLIDRVRERLGVASLRVGAETIFAYPLLHKCKLGAIVVFARERELDPMEDLVLYSVLQVFSNYYALLDTSQRDRLTGLLNRYSLEMNLDRLWAVLGARQHEAPAENNRRQTHAKQYWLAIMDLDHFKRINDTYGHIIGDEVLILATRVLSSALRHTDLLYRYGGEEFVAVIAADDLKDATLAFERARRAMEAHAFPQVGTVTISMGFAGADPGVLPEVVISRADRALYQAKGDGRNRVYHFETLIAQGVLQEMGSGDIDLF